MPSFIGLMDPDEIKYELALLVIKNEMSFEVRYAPYGESPDQFIRAMCDYSHNFIPVSVQTAARVVGMPLDELHDRLKWMNGVGEQTRAERAKNLKRPAKQSRVSDPSPPPPKPLQDDDDVEGVLTLEQALSMPTITIPDAGRLFFGLSRNAAYAAARRGDIPTIRVGNRMRVVTLTIAERLKLKTTF